MIKIQVHANIKGRYVLIKNPSGYLIISCTHIPITRSVPIEIIAIDIGVDRRSSLTCSRKAEVRVADPRVRAWPLHMQNRYRRT